MNKSLSLLLPLIIDKETGNGFAVDVGAYHGKFSLFLMQTGLFSKVVAFEPNPKNFLVIERSLSSDADSLFEAINSGLSDKSTILKLYSDEDTSTGSLLKYDPNYNSAGVIEISTVSILTLDDYIELNSGLGKLKFLKIDTQGSDLAVIRGGIRVISKDRPIIQTEFIYAPLYEGQCTPAELKHFLSDLGYALYSLNNLHISPEGRLCFCDAIFVPKEINISITQEFHCIDDELSLHSQVQMLTDICADRLSVIHALNAEVQRLRSIESKVSLTHVILSKLKSWAR
jgi:FkbM family methyltransferase